MIYLSHERAEAHGFQSAKDSNEYCGDSFYLTINDDYMLCVVADGLGSGKYAYESSQSCVSVVKANQEEDVETLMDYCNRVLLRKRGAAVAILKVDFKSQEFEYSCVGNIRFYLYKSSGKLIYPMPVTGYLSGKPQKYRTQRYKYEPNSRFLMHSDGFINVNTKSLLTSFQSIPEIVTQIKELQIDTHDDMTFITGALL